MGSRKTGTFHPAEEVLVLTCAVCEGKRQLVRSRGSSRALSYRDNSQIQFTSRNFPRRGESIGP
jgi:hypothetical protein